MSAPRILVLFGNVPLLGQERGNIEALDALARSGCEVLFLIRAEWTRDTVQRELSRRGLAFVTVPFFDALRHGVSPWVWIRNLVGILRGSWRLLRVIRSFGPTHLHVGGLANVVNFLPALAITRIPLVFRVGDVPHTHHAFWRWIWRFACWRTARFACNCLFLRDEIVGQGAPSERTTLIYSRPSDRPQGDRPRASGSRGGPHFVYVGQMTWEKGVSLLVRAAMEICREDPHAQFTLAGEVRAQNVFAREQIVRVKDAGLAERIRFAGYVTDVDALLASADVHVCPSLTNEGLVNVVLEAKQAGRPSIVFPSGGLRELVEHGVDGYLCPAAGYESLRDALRHYLRHPDLASAQGPAAKASLDRLGVEDFAARWRALYDETSLQVRILVLFGNVPLLGQERANIETLAALQDTGAKVRFLIRGEWTQQTIQPVLEQRAIEYVSVPYFDALRHRVPLSVWWRNISGILGGSWHLLRQIRQFQATHLHVGSIAGVVNFLPGLALTRLPLVYRAGDVPPQHHMLWRLAWQFTLLRVRIFVCDSNFIRRKLVAIGASKTRTAVIYAPPPKRKTVDAMPIPRAAGMTFVYIGQISADKGVDLLVQAACDLCRDEPFVRFFIAGNYSWDNPLGARLVEEIKADGLEERVRFLGYIDDIDALFAASDVHVFPSVWQEPYGLSVIEAKQHGLPSIIFPVGGVVELVEDGVTGHVCGGPNLAALRDGLRYYLRNPELARIHGAAAKESMRRFAFDHFGIAWRAVYDQAH